MSSLLEISLNTLFLARKRYTARGHKLRFLAPSCGPAWPVKSTRIVIHIQVFLTVPRWPADGMPKTVICGRAQYSIPL